MVLDWSEQSPHIRTLYRPWQPGDGYDEEAITAAQVRLGFRLPIPLQTFYRAWGQRQDMTKRQQILLPPDHLFLWRGALLLCEENQASWYWAVQREALEEANPPVMVGYNEPEAEVGTKSPWWLSHSHLSDFLDDLTYFHAFQQGAIHGGYTIPAPPLPQEQQSAWLEQHWRKASVTSMAFGMLREPTDQWADPLLYVRDGQALYWLNGYHVATREADALDEIGQVLQITWAARW